MGDYSFKFTNENDAESFKDYVLEEELWVGHHETDYEVVVVSICETTAIQLYDWIASQGLKLA